MSDFKQLRDKVVILQNKKAEANTKRQKLLDALVERGYDVSDIPALKERVQLEIAVLESRLAAIEAQLEEYD